MASTAPRRILVVDDEPLVCDSIRRMLAVDGYEAELATSGEAALALLEDHRFDMVIVDYELPGMKGDELAAAIKALDSNQPIALITAYAESLQSAHTPPASVDLVIGKPFDLKELRQAVAHLLSSKGHSGTTDAR